MKTQKHIFKERRRQGRPSVSPTRVVQSEPNKPWFNAIHEAGHAVASVVFGLPLASVEIKKRELQPGLVSVGQTNSDGLDLEDIRGKGGAAAMPYIVRLLAGPFAEERVNPTNFEGTAHKGDWDGAWAAAMIAVWGHMPDENAPAPGPDEDRQIMSELKALKVDSHALTKRLVTENWPVITRVAELLLERTELTGEEVAAIVNAARP